MRAGITATSRTARSKKPGPFRVGSVLGSGRSTSSGIDIRLAFFSRSAPATKTSAYAVALVGTAVAGQAALRLVHGGGGGLRLRRRQQTIASLTLTAVDAAGNRSPGRIMPQLTLIR
ncbi:MAG: hypothetical protein WA862_02130 [Solirubrobacterales bacterium]